MWILSNTVIFPFSQKGDPSFLTKGHILALDTSEWLLQGSRVYCSTGMFWVNFWWEKGHWLKILHSMRTKYKCFRKCFLSFMDKDEFFQKLQWHWKVRQRYIGQNDVERQHTTTQMTKSTHVRQRYSGMAEVIDVLLYFMSCHFLSLVKYSEGEYWEQVHVKAKFSYLKESGSPDAVVEWSRTRNCEWI